MTGPSTRTTPPRPGRWTRCALATAVVLLVTSCASPGSGSGPGGTPVALALDWDTCNLAQWRGGDFGEEVGDAHQSTVVRHPRRTGTGCANRFEIHASPTDIWNQHSFRSLLARYDTQEGWGAQKDVVYGFSFRFPIEEKQNRLPSYTLLWELHHRGQFTDLSPNLAITPHAIELLPDGRLVYRLAAGAAAWDGTKWTGWSTWMPENTLLAHVSTDTWYDVIIRLRFSETADGLTQVYVRRAGDRWPSQPTWQVCAANLPWVPAAVDSGAPNGISSRLPDPRTGHTGLYLSVGLYFGQNEWSGEATQQIIMYMDELRRYTDVRAAQSGFTRD
jgi:hypothetical protein